MTKSVAVDQLVKENAILVKENPTRFFEEKENLQTALKYMEEDSDGAWKFKSTVPTANAINMKNRLGMDNARMKRIASTIMRKENRITNGDQTKKWLVIALAVGAVGVGAWYLFFRKKRNGTLPPFETQEQSPSVFDAIMKKPKRKPRKVVKKMVMEEFNDDEDDDEGFEHEYEGEET